jgi:hypothetical protein
MEAVCGEDRRLQRLRDVVGRVRVGSDIDIILAWEDIDISRVWADIDIVRVWAERVGLSERSGGGVVSVLQTWLLSLTHSLLFPETSHWFCVPLELAMASAAGKAGSEPLREVAEACKKKEWSKAIRIITSLPETANSPLLLWYARISRLRVTSYGSRATRLLVSVEDADRREDSM